MGMARISFMRTSIRTMSRPVFMRIEWALDGFDLAPNDFRAEFNPLATDLHMEWRLKYSVQKPAVSNHRSWDFHSDIVHERRGGYQERNNN